MTTKTSINKATLLPLEYCTPKRAATLLGCEVGDIYHWAATGVIDLYLDTRGVGASTGTFLFAESASGSSSDLQFGASCETVYDFFTQNALYRDDVLPRDRVVLDTHFVLYGVWRIPKFVARVWEGTGCVENSTAMPMNLTLYANKNSGGGDDAIYAYDIQIESSVLKQWTFLIRDDLLLLEKHIDSGNPFTPVPTPVQDAKTEMLSSRRPAAQEERHAQNRNCVYIAILRALDLRKEECLKSAANWARQVFDLEDTVFEDGVCPLSQDTVTKMISTAMNKGQRHWEKLSSRRPAAQEECHAQNKNCVYVAILRALTLQKEECLKSPANWAKQVIDLKDTLFEHGVCPLSQDAVTEMISTAMNKDQQHWE